MVGAFDVFESVANSCKCPMSVFFLPPMHILVCTQRIHDSFICILHLSWLSLNKENPRVAIAIYPVLWRPLATLRIQPNLSTQNTRYLRFSYIALLVEMPKYTKCHLFKIDRIVKKAAYQALQGSIINFLPFQFIENIIPNHPI